MLPLEVRELEGGRSYGSIHVQTDDVARGRAGGDAVRAAARAARAAARDAAAERWIAVYDDVCDRDPRRCAGWRKELSERTGAVVLALGVEHDEVVRFVLLRGRRAIVDEYLSVPEYYGTLPPGDVIALAREPAVVARLTGAEPAAVRAVARTAASPDELPPAPELLEHRRRDRARGSGARVGGRDHALRRRPLPVLRPRADRRSPRRGSPYETVEIDLARPARRGCTRRTRPGKVPVLEEDGWILPESAVIAST